jgi:tetratricopeptide (TPR) repeat protein
MPQQIMDPSDLGDPDPRMCFAAALTSFAEAIEIDPIHGPAWAGRSSLLLRLGRPAEAMECAETGVSVAPELGETWVALGHAQLRAGRLADASESAERAMELDASMPAALGLRAAVLTESGRHDEAEDARDAHVDAVIQHLLYRQGADWEGRFEDALEEVEEDLAADPGDADLLARRGFILSSYGRRLEHLESARRGVAENTDDPMEWQGLSDALYALGRYEASATAARRSTELDPGDEIGWSSLGLALNLLDRPAEALAAFERARDIDPLYSGFWQYCAEMLEELGREDEAREAFARAMDLAASEADEEGGATA